MISLLSNHLALHTHASGWRFYHNLFNWVYKEYDEANRQQNQNTCSVFEYFFDPFDIHADGAISQRLRKWIKHLENLINWNNETNG